MTDQTNAVNDLGLPGATPPAPQVPPLSYAEAESQKAAMLADPDIRAKILAGDVETNATWKRVIEGLAHNTPPKPAEPNNTDDMVEHLRSRAEIPEDVAQQIREGRPVSSYERKQAEQLKDRHFRDKAWVSRYFDGDQYAVTQKALLDVVLAAPVKDANT